MSASLPEPLCGRLKTGEPLARHTAWRIGGPARYYLEVHNPPELQTALAWAQHNELPVFLLGGGTNLLVPDTGFGGLVLRYRDQHWQVTPGSGDSGTLSAGAGAPMAGTVRRVAGQGWGGLEWAEGLPGTIGGAVYGNAGCYGGDIASVLICAELLVDGAVEQWPAARFGFSYRSSILKNMAAVLAAPIAQQPAYGRPIVLTATLRVQRADPAELAATMARIAAERKGKTPWGSSCGSVFKNPPGNSAGRLIEQAGLKGRRVGAAEISQRHANYIVNLGGASSADVLQLIAIAREEVFRRFDIQLELEVQVVE